MSIQSASEFETVSDHVRTRLTMELTQRGQCPSLRAQSAIWTRPYHVARQPKKLKELRSLLEQLTDVVNKQIPNDDTLMEQLGDLNDYVDYRI